MLENRAATANYRARQKGFISNLHAGELRYVLGLFDNKCAYCLQDLTLDNLEFDHPIAINGDRSNQAVFQEIVVPSCKECNRKKGAKNYDDFIEIDHENFIKIAQLIENL